jgi:isocitrate lyase
LFAILRGFLLDSNRNDEEAENWVSWAKRKADWFDPIIAGDDELFGKREHGKDEKEKQLNESILHGGGNDPIMQGIASVNPMVDMLWLNTSIAPNEENAGTRQIRRGVHAGAGTRRRMRFVILIHSSGIQLCALPTRVSDINYYAI